MPAQPCTQHMSCVYCHVFCYVQAVELSKVTVEVSVRDPCRPGQLATQWAVSTAALCVEGHHTELHMMPTEDAGKPHTQVLD